MRRCDMWRPGAPVLRVLQTEINTSLAGRGSMPHTSYPPWAMYEQRKRPWFMLLRHLARTHHCSAESVGDTTALPRGACFLRSSMTRTSSHPLGFTLTCNPEKGDLWGSCLHHVCVCFSDILNVPFWVLFYQWAQKTVHYYVKIGYCTSKDGL